MKSSLLYALLLILMSDAVSAQDYLNPCVSPNGKHIIFGIQYSEGQHLYIANADGSEANILVAKSGYNINPAWSPDSRSILFLNKKDVHSESADIYILDFNSAKQKLVYKQLNIDKVKGSQSVSWSPDQKSIYYSEKNEEGQQCIVRFNLENSEKNILYPEKLTSIYSGPIASNLICERIKDLSSDEFQGRKPGTPGGEKTVEYLIREFRKLGLKPIQGDHYTQEVPLAIFSTIAPSRIYLKSADDSVVELNLKNDYLLASKYPKEKVSVSSTEWVFAGFGIYAPELGWDDYKSADITGKTVVVLSGTPNEYSLDSTLWKGDLAANLYGQNFYKKEEALKRGAKGVIFVYKQPSHSFWNWQSLANSFGQNSTDIFHLKDEDQLQFYGLIHPDAMKRLHLKNGIHELNYQKQALEPNFKPVKLGVQRAFNFSNAWTNFNTNNVIGMIPGSDRAEEAIIYTAHWDHVGMGEESGDKDVIFNGAVDNASGTAAILEIAHAYKRLKFRPRRSIVFIAMAAEEMGMLGSKYYIENPLFPHSQTLASFNMDAHFPYGKTTHITGVVYGRSELDKYLEMAARRQGRVILPNTEQNIAQNIFFRSDHYPFAVAGIPSEFAVGAGNSMAHDSIVWMEKMSSYMSKYHQVTDEYEEDFDCGGISQDAELVFMAGIFLDHAEKFPEWVRSKTFDRIRREMIKKETEKTSP